MRVSKKRAGSLYLIVGGCAILLLGVATALAAVFPTPFHTIVPGSTVTFSRPEAATTLERGPVLPLVEHVPTPTSVKAIYLSQCVAGTPSFRDSLVKFIDSSDLNSVVIDIRDYTGRISWWRSPDL